MSTNQATRRRRTPTDYDRLRETLEVVAAACVHRDKARNACWLSGPAAIVHLIEAALRETPKQPAPQPKPGRRKGGK